MSRNLILAIIIGIIFGLSVYTSLKSVLTNDLKFSEQKYKPVFTGYILPIALFAGFLSNVLIGIQHSFILFVNYCVNLILIITVYYLIIFLFLKLFRKYFHPLVVSTIWMLPNILYFFIMYRHELYVDQILILEVSPLILYSIFILWLVIFVIIFGYKIYEHLKYRKLILEDAQVITDETIIKMFEDEKSKIDFKIKDLKLMKSKNIHTPLTIGVRKKVIVLPNRNYSEEEYQLIFKHEMIHIARCDVDAKVYFAFCNALCWFHPLMWIANKKCSEDLELSCDTSVLTNKDSITRKQYARLILKNASSEKGFTSCLSTNAKSLQYRLKNIVEPKFKKTGGLLIFILVFLLVGSWGNVGVAVQGYKGFESIFDSKDVNLERVYPVNIEYRNQIYSFENEDEIIDYISNLELSHLPNAIIEDDKTNQYLWLVFELDSKLIDVFLYDYYVVVEDDLNNEEYYYVKEGIDFEYLNQMIVEYPSLRLSMRLNEVDMGFKMWPTLRQVSTNDEIVYTTDKDSSYHDYYSYYPTDFKFEFYDEVLSDIEVIEETKEGIKTYLVHKDDFIHIPEKDVTYTINATCKKNNQIYEVMFTFDLETIKDNIGE